MISNPFRCVHAAALITFGETVGTLALYTLFGKHDRAILTNISAEVIVVLVILSIKCLHACMHACMPGLEGENEKLTKKFLLSLTQNIITSVCENLAWSVDGKLNSTAH